jgi:hypothetical protein
MRIIGLDRYAPLETALKGVGFKVDEVEKQGKRTVITVIPRRAGGKRPVKAKSICDMSVMRPKI